MDVPSIIIVIRLGGSGGLEDGSGYGAPGGGGGEIPAKGIQKGGGLQFQTLWLIVTCLAWER